MVAARERQSRAKAERLPLSITVPPREHAPGGQDDEARAVVQRGIKITSSHARSVSSACNCVDCVTPGVGQRTDVAPREAGPDNGAVGEEVDWLLVIVELAEGFAESRKPASISASSTLWCNSWTEIRDNVLANENLSHV